MDSTIVLSWLKQHPTCWKTFIANRVSSIQTRLPTARWGFVRSEMNPTDCASRGIDLSTLQNFQLWWRGPLWLSQNAFLWPEPSLMSETDTERKSESLLVTKTEYPSWDLAEAISTWPRLLRVTALCILFIHKLRIRMKNARAHGDSSLDLTQAIRAARTYWIGLVQKLCFESEICSLLKGEALPKSSKLKRLLPFIDKEGLIRVGEDCHMLL